MQTMKSGYDLNLHHLELFHAVVQEGNVSRAAVRLGVSQPAVSKQLREMEERTGLSLLERLPRGVRPTEAGMELAVHARELFAVRDRAERSLRDRLDRKAGTLAVGASRTVGGFVLPGILSRYREMHPGIGMRVEVGNTARVEELLRDGSVEVGLVEGEISPDLPHGTFGRDELVPVASPGFFPLGKSPRSLAEFCRRPYVLREAGSGSRFLVERALARAGLACRPLASLDSTDLVRSFAEAGLAGAFLPRIAAAAFLEKGTLVEFAPRGVDLRRVFRWILWPDRAPSPAVQALLELLRAGN
jgi:DNA-binding transcriptional LysR family regulator